MRIKQIIWVSSTDSGKRLGTAIEVMRLWSVHFATCAMLFVSATSSLIL